MENVDKRKSTKLVSRWESKGRKLGTRALIAEFNFRNVLQFTDDKFAIQMKKCKFVMIDLSILVSPFQNYQNIKCTTITM